MSFIHNPANYNTKAAREIVPIFLKLFKIKSVIDVGCGIGTWLSVFQDFGIKDILGIDGDYVDKNLLYSHIDKNKFIAHDLTKPFIINRKFDLVTSLEVAEHIPEESADVFVKTLVSLGDYIIFSAAIPNQGGENHVNEQWPSYWQDKFAKEGFEFYDSIRGNIWSNDNVDWWYKQNMFFVVSKKVQFLPPEISNIYNIVHPDLYNEKIRALEANNQKIIDIYSGNIPVKLLVSILLKSLKKQAIFYLLETINRFSSYN